LNGTVFAAAIRAGMQREQAKKLTELWREDGDWAHTLDLSLGNILCGSGLSDQGKLLHLLRKHVKPCTRTTRFPVSLEIIVAATGGVRGAIGEEAASTYEVFLSFSDSDFDTQEGLERIFTATVASCSFPIVFAPTVLPGIGPCIHG